MSTALSHSKTIIGPQTTCFDFCIFCKMSSPRDSSLSPESMESSDEYSDAGDGMEVVNIIFLPYQDEPLASDTDNPNEDGGGEEADVDGLTPALLASRYRREVSVNEWCECIRCSEEHLVGTLEFRCCREVGEAMGKLIFYGSIERMECVTQHEDYITHTNKSVLLNVAPLLKDKNGDRIAVVLDKQRTRIKYFLIIDTLYIMQEKRKAKNIALNLVEKFSNQNIL